MALETEYSNIQVLKRWPRRVQVGEQFGPLIMLLEAAFDEDACHTVMIDLYAMDGETYLSHLLCGASHSATGQVIDSTHKRYTWGEMRITEPGKYWVFVTPVSGPANHGLGFLQDTPGEAFTIEAM